MAGASLDPYDPIRVHCLDLGIPSGKQQDQLLRLLRDFVSSRRTTPIKSILDAYLSLDEEIPKHLKTKCGNANTKEYAL